MVEHNEKLKTPFVKKISPYGTFKLIFDGERMIEGDNQCFVPENEEEAYEIDQLQRVYGVPADQAQRNLSAEGVSLYIEVSEMANPDDLKFSYSSFDFE